MAATEEDEQHTIGGIKMNLVLSWCGLSVDGDSTRTLLGLFAMNSVPFLFRIHRFGKPMESVDRKTNGNQNETSAISKDLPLELGANDHQHLRIVAFAKSTNIL